MKAELAVPRGAGPSASERYLDVSVGENQWNIFAIGNVNRLLQFGTGLDACLCAHTFLIRAQNEVCDEGRQLLFLDDISQVCIFPTVGVLDGLEAPVVEFYADRVRGFGFDGLMDQVLGNLRNMGGTYEDNFPVVLGMDTVDVGLSSRHRFLDFFRLRIGFIHTVDVM